MKALIWLSGGQVSNIITTNVVSLSGTIISNPVLSHEIYQEAFYELQIEVKRLSNQSDILPITISQHLIDNETLHIGNTITIIGQFRSYNKLIDGKSRLMLTVFVREIVNDNQINPNSIVLSGFICKPPIYRTTPFNREICDILLAVNRAYNKSDYIPCIAWGRNARFVRNLSVGEQVIIHGRIQSRAYQKRLSDEQVINKVAYEVSVSKLLSGEFAANELIMLSQQGNAETYNEYADAVAATSSNSIRQNEES